MFFFPCLSILLVLTKSSTKILEEGTVHMNHEKIVKVHDGYCHKNLIDDLSRLIEKYPLLEIKNVGKSVLGRSIPAVKLGDGPRKIHYNGSFHANEWITSLLLMVFIEKFLEAKANNEDFFGININDLWQKRTLWVIPMVNPDGVDLVQNGLSPDNPYYKNVLQANKGSTNFRNWKANIRGVDLNDQFPANWEREYHRRNITEPAPMNYPGPNALSEPEAEAIANFTIEQEFDLVIAFHTQGEEIYWGYEKLEPEESGKIIKRFQKVSGYRAIRYVDSDAGYKDWFIYKWQKPGFTVECGLGQNPLPISQFQAIWSKVSKIMIEGLII